MGSHLDVDSVISQLLQVRKYRTQREVKMRESDIRAICLISRALFVSEPALLKVKPPVYICGDIHGQYYDLLNIFDRGGYPPETSYLFLGNYVDRGRYSLETVCLLFAYRIKYPKRFFMLRGNHECANLSRLYGFYDDCKRRYNVQIWKTFMDCFDSMPVCAVVGRKIFCVHGGPSPTMKKLKDVNKMLRPRAVPMDGLLVDLLWAEADPRRPSWGLSPRAATFTYGARALRSFLEANRLSLLCRADRPVAEGYFLSPEHDLVSLFSVPDYCDKYDNDGAVMLVKKGLKCSFIVFPSRKKFRSEQDLF